MRAIRVESDTRIGRRDRDPTHVLYLVTGQRVQVVAGPMRGLRGTFVDRRQSGVLLLRAGSGLYLEVSEFSVQLEGKK